jgi:hypothetical protein
MQNLRSARLPGSSGDGGAASGTSGNLTLNTLSREASAHLFGTGKSLTWDEFQNPEDDGLLSAENSPSKAGLEKTPFLKNPAKVFFWVFLFFLFFFVFFCFFIYLPRRESF